MTVLNGTITTDDMVEALNEEMVENFRGEFDRFSEILGEFSIETATAGTALYQYKITGELNNDTVAEGDIVPLSEYELEKIPVGEIEIDPKAKMTTAQAILKGGYENAILRTDKKFIQQGRAKILNDFFTSLNAGTGRAYGANLQKLLANVDAELGNTMENHNDEAGDVIHFINRSDAADYLGDANISTQTLFGLDYLESFLGIKHVILTNKISRGKVIATPVDNIHIRGIDFSALADAGLAYTYDDLGLIGVQHEAKFDRTSAITYMLLGMNALAEILDYIIIGEIGSAPEYEYTSYSDAECTQQLGYGKAKYISDDGSWTLIEVVENVPEGFTGNRYKVNGTVYTAGTVYQLYTPGGEATGMYVKLGAAEVAEG